MDFWKTFEIDAEWVEYHPTLRDMAASADAVVIGEVVDVRRGTRIQGDAVEDVVDEVILDIRVRDAVLTFAPTALEMTLTYPHPGLVDATIDELRAAVPDYPVLLLLRRRASGKFTPVNGYGLWTCTARGPLDAPLNPEPPSDFGLYERELATHETISELAESLR